MEDEKYIFEGKTTSEAIENGLKELKKNKNQVEIKVLENEEKKTFFSILAPKIVKVEMKIKPTVEKEKTKEKIDDVVKEIENFMKNFISKLPTNNLKFEVQQQKNLINVNISDNDASYLIGYRGETLNALQSILSNIASNGRQEKVPVLLNIGNYREKREDDLKKLSEKIAESVEKRGKSITLEPMSAYDRKIVHTILQDHEKVKTYSIGTEPYRKVVVSLK